jgi:hypothetical protein
MAVSVGLLSFLAQTFIVPTGRCHASYRAAAHWVISADQMYGVADNSVFTGGSSSAISLKVPVPFLRWLWVSDFLGFSQRLSYYP